MLNKRSNMTTVDNYMDDEIITQPRVVWSPYQLSVAFPRSAAHAKRKRSSLIQEVFALQDLARSEHFVTNFVLIDGPIADKMEWVAYLDKYISYLKKTTTHEDGVNVEKAKQVPITNYLEVNRQGFASCPKHSDRTPSLKYYPKDNTFHCHQCGWGRDVIDFVMGVEGCDFITAVKRLGV